MDIFGTCHVCGIDGESWFVLVDQMSRDEYPICDDCGWKLTRNREIPQPA